MGTIKIFGELQKEILISKGNYEINGGCIEFEDVRGLQIGDRIFSEVDTEYDLEVLNIDGNKVFTNKPKDFKEDYYIEGMWWRYFQKDHVR